MPGTAIITCQVIPIAATDVSIQSPIPRIERERLKRVEFSMEVTRKNKSTYQLEKMIDQNLNNLFSESLERKMNVAANATIIRNPNLMIKGAKQQRGVLPYSLAPTVEDSEMIAARSYRDPKYEKSHN